ncbi:hypothetical protein B0J14DRAFT_691464 [Halenospora varia]|nr:hypothetical protein B0J14DRAFT_691464 [Halenospora varia]
MDSNFMDYTMDSNHASRHPNTASRCQYQQSQQHSNFNPGSSSREGQRYDPVHDTNSWFQSGNPASHIRPSYPSAPVPFASWEHQPASYIPIHNWQSFGETQQGAHSQAPDLLNYRSNNTTMGMPNAPWSETRGYEPMPFGYTAYNGAAANNNALGDQTNGRSSGLPPSQPPHAFPPHHSSFVPREPNYSVIQQELVRARAARLSAASNHSSSSSGSSVSPPRNAIEANFESPARRSPPAATLVEHRSPHGTTRTARYNNARMSNWLDPGSHRRRPVIPHAAHLDSDDEEDAEIEAARIREAELFFSPDMDEERAMAAMRGAIASSKKVPSREAIAALEVVKVEDLKEADKTCIICYNEFGVSNPEGLIEKPIRLPKCKHIFGDKCIKKWFEDSDSCPYCRDKLPSEMSVRKGIAIETLSAVRAHRERLIAAAATAQGLRSRHGLFTTRGNSLSEDSTRNTAPTSANRAQDEYEYAMHRAADSWFSPPIRTSHGELAAYRRQQGRGRLGGNRASHHLRPTSVGSARFAPSSTFTSAAQRAQVPGPTSNNSGQPERRSITPAVPRQNNGTSAQITYQAPSQPDHQLTNLSPTETQSPPVAVGSTSAVESNFGSDEIQSPGLARHESVRERRARELRDLQRQAAVFTQHNNDHWSDQFSPPRGDGSPDSENSLSPRSNGGDSTRENRSINSYQPAYSENHEYQYPRIRGGFGASVPTDNNQSRWSQ